MSAPLDLAAIMDQKRREMRIKRGMADLLPPEEGEEAGEGVTRALGENLLDLTSPLRSVPQVAGGVLDLVANLHHSIQDVAREVEKRTGAKLGGVAYDAERGFHLQTVDEFSESQTSLEDALAAASPAKPNTVTGRMIRGASQFLAGLYLTRGLPGVKALEGAGAAGRYAATSLRGGAVTFAGFDPHEARLSNLVESFPKLRNPVTGYLRADPNDSAAEARTKAALEGLGMGALTDGLLAGLRLVRAGVRGRVAAAAAEAQKPGSAALLGDEAAETLARLEGAKARLTELIGDPEGDLLQVRPLPEGLDTEAAAGALATAQGREKSVYVNWARIDTEDDVKAVIQDAADAFSGRVDTARRGVRTWAQTRLSAEQENAWKVLAERRNGEPLNAEQTLAVRELWTRSGEKLKELADLVAIDPSDLNQVAFRKMLAVHATVQDQVIAVRTETARALNIWRIPAGRGAGLLSQLDDLGHLVAADKGKTVEIAVRIKGLAEAGMLDKADRFVRRSLLAQSEAAVRQAFYFSILSGPRTHLRNLIGSTANLALEIIERRGAAMVGKLLGDQSVPDGEAASMVFGLLHGFRDAFRISENMRQVLSASWDEAGVSGVRRAIREADPTDMPGMYRVRAGGQGRFGAGKAADAVTGEWDPAKFGMKPDSLPGRAFSALDSVTTITSKALQAEDELTRGMAFQAQMNALAFRKASAEVASGAVPREGLAGRIAELLDDDDASMKMAAELFARRATLNDPLPGNALARTLRNWSRIPVLGPLTMPFPRIMYATQREFLRRTPVGLLSKGFWEDMAAGGVRRDTAISKVALGTAALATAVDLALSGFITGRGPSDPGARASLQATGWLPYAVKLQVGTGANGEPEYRYFQLRGMEPVSSVIAFAGDAGELVQYVDWANPDRDLADLGMMAVVAIGSQMTAAPFVQGTAGFFEGMSDPTGRGAGALGALLRHTAGSVIPNALATFEPAADPTMREAFTAMDVIRSRTPGLSDSLPARRDIWGREMEASSGFGGLYDAVSPIASKKARSSIVDTELARLRHFVSRPDMVQSWMGTSVDLRNFPNAYSRLVELSGTRAHAALERLMSDRRSAYWRLSDGPDGDKAALIDQVVSQSRAAARVQLLAEFPELKAEVRTRRAEAKPAQVAALTRQ